MACRGDADRPAGGLDLTAAPRLVTLEDGAQIAVWDSGEADDSAVLFLHGFPENRLCWRPVLERLHVAQRRVA